MQNNLVKMVDAILENYNEYKEYLDDDRKILAELCLGRLGIGLLNLRDFCKKNKITVEKKNK